MTAVADDRDWFERHPGMNRRYRPFIRGEAPNPAEEVRLLTLCADAQREHPELRVSAHVEVLQLWPGLRWRRPFMLLSPRADEEDTP